MTDRQYHEGVKRTDVAELDDEHQALHDDATDIVRLISAMAPPDEVADRFDAFRRALADHFRHEEDLAGEGGYTATEDHRREHGRLNREAARLLKEFRKAGPALSSGMLLDFLAEVQNHVAFRDTEHRFSRKPQD